MASLVQFLFIVAVPIVIVAGGLVALFAVGALFDVLENPAEWSRRVEGFFKGTPKPSKMAGDDHYYKPYWAGR